MNPDDPLPVDVTACRVDLVGEVVMKQGVTHVARRARARCPTRSAPTCCEQIPLYLEFFGFGQVTADEPRAVARLV